MKLTSTAFTDHGDIPSRHTCEGEDVAPPLAWTDVPAGTRSLALVVDVLGQAELMGMYRKQGQ